MFHETCLFLAPMKDKERTLDELALPLAELAYIFITA